VSSLLAPLRREGPAIAKQSSTLLCSEETASAPARFVNGPHVMSSTRMCHVGRLHSAVARRIRRIPTNSACCRLHVPTSMWGRLPGRLGAALLFTLRNQRDRGRTTGNTKYTCYFNTFRLTASPAQS
jgi:hypothetical protein